MQKLFIDEKFRSVMPERIIKRVSIDENNCWNWIPKGKHPYGYGKYIYTQNKKKFHLGSHRASWMAFKGGIPEGLCVCHKCDNAACCNPDHLFLATPKDNTHDMMNKGRFPDFRGEKNSSAILDEGTVREIRRLHCSGESVASIARKYGIKYFTCLDVVNRRNWRHI